MITKRKIIEIALKHSVQFGKLIKFLELSKFKDIDTELIFDPKIQDLFAEHFENWIYNGFGFEEKNPRLIIRNFNEANIYSILGDECGFVPLEMSMFNNGNNSFENFMNGREKIINSSNTIEKIYEERMSKKLDYRNKEKYLAALKEILEPLSLIIIEDLGCDSIEISVKDVFKYYEKIYSKSLTDEDIIGFANDYIKICENFTNPVVTSKQMLDTITQM